MKYTRLMPMLFFIILPFHSFAAEPDTLSFIDISRDTVDETPREWNNAYSGKQRLLSNYTVRYDADGPYIHAASNSAGSWIERDAGEIDIDRFPFLEWEWRVNRFPDVEWERNRDQDDFAIRLEMAYDYKGGKWHILNILRKGLITALLRGNPPMTIVSYVWSVEVPVEESYISPESNRLTIIPIESGIHTAGRWMRERRDIRADLEHILPDEQNLVLKKIRIRCNTENSGSTAESGIRYIRLISAGEEK